MIGSFSNPSQILEEVGISKGMVIVDVGSGSGHYAFASARLTGNDGKVYALEVQKDLVEKLKKDSERNGLINVSPIWCNVEKIGGTKLADKVADLIIVANVFFQIEDKKVFLNELSRIIKDNGFVLLVDWLDSFGGLGPTSDLVVREDQAVSLFENIGFKKNRNVHAGAHHYGIIFSK